MISALIRVPREDPALLDTLAALVPAVADGLLRDAVLLADQETDYLRTVADASGCMVVAEGQGNLRSGAAAARAPWLMVLEAGLVPGGPWIEDIADAVRDREVAVFTLRARRGPGPALRAAALNVMAGVVGIAHPDLGLVLPRECIEAGERLPRVRRLGSVLHDRRGAPARS
ncbi:hypothetical protein [Alsobacter sp. R-9]